MLDLILDFREQSFEKNYKFALDKYQDKLYLAIVNFEKENLSFDFKVLGYKSFNKEWQTLYQKNIKVSEIVEKYQVKIFKVSNVSNFKQVEIIFIFKYSNKFITLGLDNNNQIINQNIYFNSFYWDKINQGLLVENSNKLLWLPELIYLDNQTNNPYLEIIKLNNLIEITSQNLTINNNFIKDNFRISHVLSYQDNFYLGMDHERQGFTILKKPKREDNNENSWQCIIRKGAYRYSLNQKIFFMTFFQDALYISSGLNLNEKNWEENKLYPSGFEMIRIYNDNDWDLIVGNPQFTPQGLKVPLSGYGSGFNNPYNCIVESLNVHKNKLYLLTKDIDNLQLWQSNNGEDWESNNMNFKLENYTDFKIIKSLSFSWGLIFLVNLTSLYLENNIYILVFTKE
jgi:hypothetical protein